MLSIQEELAKIRREREERFILVSDLLDYLKSTNHNSNYQEIATFLLIKFRPNNFQYTDEPYWTEEEYEYWHVQNGIAVFKLFDELDRPPEFVKYEAFFDFLEDVKKYPFVVENSVKEVFEDSNETYARIAVERTRIEELLGVKLPISELVENEYRKDIIFNVSAALTKTEEFIKNTDINKSPVGLAERLVFQEEIKQKNAKIVELENQNAELKRQLEVLATQDYNAEIPPNTNREKLREFIELVASDEFFENGKLLSYSRLHTALDRKHRGKRITSKNTIGRLI